MPAIKTIFFGTPAFAAATLKTLAANPFFDVIAAVTQPDRPTGRKKILTPPPVKVFALENGIKVLQPEKLRDEAIAEIAALKPELAVVVAYGNLIPKRLLDAVPMGFINVHGSLLPKHRGASPLTAAILAGDEETGVCLMVLDEQMDHGPVIACRRAQLDSQETTESLRKKLTPLANELMDKELVEYVGGRMVSVPQDHARATFCKQITSEMARIDWNKPVAEIDRLVRAMRGVTPAWTMLDSKIFLIHRASPDENLPKQTRPGTIFAAGKKPSVSCANGGLVLEEVQPAGGKSMSGQSFLNGHGDILGKTME